MRWNFPATGKDSNRFIRALFPRGEKAHWLHPGLQEVQSAGGEEKHLWEELTCRGTHAGKGGKRPLKNKKIHNIFFKKREKGGLQIHNTFLRKITSSVTFFSNFNLYNKNQVLSNKVLFSTFFVKQKEKNNCFVEWCKFLQHVFSSSMIYYMILCMFIHWLVQCDTYFKKFTNGEK